MSEPCILGTVRTYADLHAVMRARANQLNIARMELDRQARLPDGYAAKLLAPHPSRYLGVGSMAKLLATLGLELLAVARSDFRPSGEKRDTSNVRMHAVKIGRGKHRTETPDFLRRIAHKGGVARANRMNPSWRRGIARRAARKRWQNAHANRVKPPRPSRPTKHPPHR